MSDPQAVFLGALIFMVGIGIIISLDRVSRELERIYMVLDNSLTVIDTNTNSIRNNIISILKDTFNLEQIVRLTYMEKHAENNIDISDDMR